MHFIRKRFAVSERRACEITGLARSTQRYAPRRTHYDERALEPFIHKFVAEHPRHGYRRFWTTLRKRGIAISLKATYRIWKNWHAR